MIGTEVLYSLRKHSRSTRWGRIAAWFQLHIFTGLVGPFLVLLHSGLKFNNAEASALLGLTLIIAVSGFAGRYIYTAVPRTADGIVMDQQQIEEQIAGVEYQVKAMLAAQQTLPAAVARRLSPQPAGFGWGRPSQDRLSLLTNWMHAKRLTSREKAQIRQLDRLARQKDRLRRQINSLGRMRRLLGYWHLFHIPIGLGMFVLAVIHIVTAVYFTNFVR